MGLLSYGFDIHSLIPMATWSLKHFWKSWSLWYYITHVLYSTQLLFMNSLFFLIEYTLTHTHTRSDIYYTVVSFVLLLLMMMSPHFSLLSTIALLIKMAVLVRSLRLMMTVTQKWLEKQTKTISGLLHSWASGGGRNYCCLCYILHMPVVTKMCEFYSDGWFSFWGSQTIIILLYYFDLYRLTGMQFSICQNRHLLLNFLDRLSTYEVFHFMYWLCSHVH